MEFIKKLEPLFWLILKVVVIIGFVLFFIANIVTMYNVSHNEEQSDEIHRLMNNIQERDHEINRLRLEIDSLQSSINTSMTVIDSLSITSMNKSQKIHFMEKELNKRYSENHDVSIVDVEKELKHNIEEYEKYK